ncbi:MAG: non-hydrolyzing UDP-N-acetylglucosamine 2-epimerase [Aestuariivirga sp.]
MRVIVAIGTRPEAIKMAPVITALRQAQGFEVIVCASGQHRDMLKSGFDIFGIAPDIDLAAMTESGSLNELMSAIVSRFDQTLDDVQPDAVLVHGDTTTASACAMAAFHRRVRVCHVEAGLRTHDFGQPWPEELNRRIVDAIAEDLFAPTKTAKRNLLAENLGQKRIYVTGNTIVDALQSIVAKIKSDSSLRGGFERAFEFLDPGKRLVLVTTHRRENFGQPLRDILAALAKIAALPGIQIVLPVHLNPNVRAPVMSALSGISNIFLTGPADYGSFIWLLDRAALVITDSGGVQEEAPSLGKPVLVMREVTERPEGVEAGYLRLVGTSASAIFDNAKHYLNCAGEDLRGKPNPYGDGHAAQRITAILAGKPALPLNGDLNLSDPLQGSREVRQAS